eukprot:1160663-Pelagomonas_calceolata.AAC.3
MMHSNAHLSTEAYPGQHWVDGHAGLHILIRITTSTSMVESARCSCSDYQDSVTGESAEDKVFLLGSPRQHYRGECGRYSVPARITKADITG